MAVERLSPPNKHNARVFSLRRVYIDIRVRCMEECDKRAISIFPCCFSPFRKRVIDGHRSIDRNNWKANEFEYRFVFIKYYFNFLRFTQYFSVSRIRFFKYLCLLLDDQ